MVVCNWLCTETFNLKSVHCNHINFTCLYGIYQAKSKPGTIRGDFCIQIGRQVYHKDFFFNIFITHQENFVQL